MSDFKAKMRQTPLGELTALPRFPTWILGDIILREGRGREKKGWKGRVG